MKVLIAGGSGTIGRRLCTALLDAGKIPAVLTRDRRSAQKTVHARTHVVEWNPATPENLSWTERCGVIDAVVNLAGASLANKRWSPARKALLRSSRLNSTRAIVHAITARRITPQVLVNASAIGYYGFHRDKIFTEEDGPGDGFLAGLCAEWEEEANKATSMGVRVTFLRTGMVLSINGGALPRMLPVFRIGLGGKLGGGRQWVSWIHIRDEIGIILSLLEKPVSGAVNAVSPNPVTNAAFTRALGGVLNRPTFFAAPVFILRAVFGEMSDLLLKSQRVIPERLKETGYTFSFPEIEPALADLLKT